MCLLSVCTCIHWFCWAYDICDCGVFLWVCVSVIRLNNVSALCNNIHYTNLFLNSSTNSSLLVRYSKVLQNISFNPKKMRTLSCHVHVLWICVLFSVQLVWSPLVSSSWPRLPCIHMYILCVKRTMTMVLYYLESLKLCGTKMTFSYTYIFFNLYFRLVFYFIQKFLLKNFMFNMNIYLMIWNFIRNWVYEWVLVGIHRLA